MTTATGSQPDPAAPHVPAWEHVFMVAGVDHRTAGQSLRDRLSLESADLPGFYRALRDGGLSQAVLIATCDRIVVAAFFNDPEAGAAALRSIMAERAGLAERHLEESFFALGGPAALSHLFSVAASLESRVLGEPEVLAQVRSAYRDALQAGGGGPEMGRVFDAAFSAAKRVRTETEIGESAVSLVAAARQVAGEVLGGFEDATACVIGGGEIGVLVAERLSAQGLTDIWVADPLAQRAESLAARLGAHRITVEETGRELDRMDIVIAALGGARPVVTAGDLAAAMKRRRFRPVFLLDAAVPPDIDPAVGEIDGAYLFTLHDLERIALAGRENRAQAADAARAVVEEEAAAFWRSESRRGASASIEALRTRFEEVRSRILEENPGISADDATRLLVNRLLHEPSRLLGRIAEGCPELSSMDPIDHDLIARIFGIAPVGNGEGRRERKEKQ